ncbi:hypothetical protein MVEN_02298500 [Mycena venus]|uniref:Uncharacterized protein n=1 Tax=Mycena venus TaxID=2733690 RepID=A0A8H6X5N4_9AGAR|nr:hypothetical protein MVEN_02298500 [Mycena venus]
MLHSLFCCCARPRVEDDPTVIPTETTHLISGAAGLPSPHLPETMAIDRQRLQERMGTIVRSKEGKMVNVNARTPFILHSASEGSSSTAPASPTAEDNNLSAPPTPTLSVLPPPSALNASNPHVVTMTPARLRLRADSRYSSPSGSRSSSRRRADIGYTTSPQSAVDRGKPGLISAQFFDDTGSESSETMRTDTVKSSVNGVTIPNPVNGSKDDTNPMSIAFSWSDT